MSTQSQGKGGHWLAVILCTLTAGLLARAAIIGDPGLRVPPVIAYIAAAIFLMGALAVLKQIAGIHRTVDGLAPLILAAFTAIGGWIALSPDAGSCEASFNGGPGTEVSGLGCRDSQSSQSARRLRNWSGSVTAPYKDATRDRHSA